MQIFFILFLVSLLGLVFMIGRKIIALKAAEREGTIMEESFDMPDLEELGLITGKKIKKYGYVALVATLRLYIRSSNLARRHGSELYQKVKGKLSRESLEASSKTREVSKFLKLVSDYKHKIKNIKHKIREEEEKEK